jgi:two-component system, LuxR family, response regulator FixJ
VSDPACVHLIDDDDLVRRALFQALLAAGLSPRVYGSAEAFVSALALLEQGCIVTDVRMPGLDGLALLAALKAHGVAHPVIVISGYADVPLAVEAMKAGAVDFLAKPVRPSVLVAAVRAALKEAGRRAEQAALAAACERMLTVLTPRQRDVLDGLVAGKLNKVIAFELGLSVRTVEGYRAEIMARTGAASLSDLVRIAVLAPAANPPATPP